MLKCYKGISNMLKLIKVIWVGWYIFWIVWILPFSNGSARNGEGGKFNEVIRQCRANEWVQIWLYLET